MSAGGGFTPPEIPNVAGVVGLYIATLAVMWQAVDFIAFQTIPSLPIVVGSALIVTGGSLIAFWKP